MDTKNRITQHSKEKLKVYKEYLKEYLSVMLKTRYKSIYVIEPFAGKGISDDGNEGSAMIAKNVILNFCGDKKYNNITLFLNDNNKNNCTELYNNLKPFDFRLRMFTKDANEFIRNILKNRETSNHSFMFIDPFGYTQINKDTYNLLFSQNNIDVLIFIPTYFIYRFLKGEETDSKYKPIAEFLNDFNINKENAIKAKNDVMFAQEIVNSIKKKINSKFVYKRQIKNENNVNSYHLFFITKHVRGAEKFLDAIWRIEKDNKDLFTTLGVISDLDTILEKEIKKKGVLNNCELYELGIELGFRVPKQQEILRQLEKDKKISIYELTGKKRRQNSFYIGFDYFNKNNKIIEIKYIGF